MKRPFMGIGIALAAGVAAGWFGLSGYSIFLAVILTLGIAIAGYIKKYWTDRTCKYVIGLSVFFVVGFCRAIICNESNDLLDPCELPSVIYGRVERIQEKAKVDYVFLKKDDGVKVLAIIKKEDSEEMHFYKGQYYKIWGTAQCFESATNPGQFDEAKYYRSLGIAYGLWADEVILHSEGDWLHRRLRWIEDMKQSMRQFYEEHMGSQGNGVLQAAVLGERSALDADLKRYYQENGWMHLITTSGLHLSFVAMNMYKRMRKMTVSVWISTWIAFALMLGYGYMTDYGDSMLRAMGMMALTLISKIVGRRTDGWTSLSVLAAGLLFLRPGRILSAGFWLTFAAVGGMEWGKWVAKILGYDIRGQKKQRMKASLCVQTGIFVMTLPILLWTMYEIPALGFIYNFFMIPLVSAIVPAAFVSGVAGCLKMPLFQWVGIAVLHVIDTVLEVVHLLPSKVWVLGCPAYWQLMLFCFGIIWATCLIEKRRKQWGIFIILLSCMLLMFVRVRKDEAIFIDVGQGDGICLLTKEGHAFMVDGGSSSVSNVYTYRLEPLLKYYGVKKVDAWFVTHGDQDHVSGVLEAIEKKAAITMIFLPEGVEDETLEEIRGKAESKDILVKNIYMGNIIRTKGVSIECLHPTKETCLGDKNNDSLVLSVRLGAEKGGVSLLLTGDLEAQGEKLLIESIGAMDVDVLKVGHHGSSGGTTVNFLESIHPEWGIISCGKENRYGHPHEETLLRMENANCQWLSTASQGAVFVRTTKEGYQILGYEKQD